MDKNTVVIAIDHGWSNMKTVHETFTSGIREITTEPALFENVLEKDGKYYKVGTERLKVKDSKVEDENYYLLSLAATAKELDRLGKRTANVYWAVGLPLTRFGKEKEAFIKYLNQNREVTFKYEKKQYHITIERISVYPQCFAAVASQISEFPAKVLVVDIGSCPINLTLHCNSGGCADCIDRILFLQRHDFCGNDEVKAALCFWQPDADLYIHGRTDDRPFVRSDREGKAEESRQHG